MTIKGEYWYSSDSKLYPCNGDVNKFGDDENLKGDDGKMKYSSLLTLAAFAYQ